MASINYGAKEISVKIVYYGPGLSGKTTNLQVIHQRIPTEKKSNMVSLATETDRTLFFDFLPLDLGKIKGFSTKFQLYTVPGQVYYNATRKLVLRGVDGVVFVADSSPKKMDENIESFQNLLDNLVEYGYQRETIPMLLQYNKRDLPDALPVEELDRRLNKFNLPWSEAVAVKGKGVFESLKIIGKIVIDELNRKYSRPAAAPGPRSAASPAPGQHGFAAQQPGAEAYTQRRAPVQPAPAPMQQPAYEHDPQIVVGRPGPQQPSRAPQQIPGLPGASQPQARPPRPAAPPPAPPSYYDHNTIDLEPMSGPAPAIPSSPREARPAGEEKTELDLEIERYQREIEERQTRITTRPLQQPVSAAAAQPPHIQPVQRTQNETAEPTFEAFEPPSPPPQRLSQPPRPSFTQPPAESQEYDVYNVEPAPAPQRPASPPPQFDDSPMYFTSVNTERPRKVKRPVNPKEKATGGFLSKLFSKKSPDE